MTTDLSVYIHVPFCIKKCRYCAFYSLDNRSGETKKLYKNAIINQLRSFSDEYGALRVDTLYIGGGTPPAIGIDNLCDIIGAVNDCLSVNTDAEVTVEINPLSVSADDIKRLADIGVNRFSIGLQSSDDVSLKKIGRIHTVSDFLKTYENCRRYCDNVSVDLMFALPDQTLCDVKKDVGFVLCLSPEHVSIYCLTLEENTFLYKHANEYKIASDDEQADMYALICEELEKNGYDHYEISNFAKKGRGSRHNSKYWERYDYAGFGAASHSFFKNKRYFFNGSVDEYIRRGLSESYSSFAGINEIDEISPDEAEKERIMLGLRMKKGIILDRTIPDALVKNGYITVDNGVVSLTDKGMFVSNMIINEFI